MTAEQLERKRAYDREWRRRKRAQLKAARKALQPVSEVPAPKTSNKPRKQSQANSVRFAKPKSERGKHREWRGNVVNYFLDCLTDEACPLTGEWFERHRISSMWMGFYDRLNQIESILDKPDLIAELRLSIAIEALRRLSGETPAGSPTLPGIAQKSV